MKTVTCIDNEANAESLIVGKVYPVLPDEDAARVSWIRVLDDTFGELGSEDGYLYPEAMFVAITLPDAAERALGRWQSGWPGSI
jgi:hypothetical protein